MNTKYKVGIAVVSLGVAFAVGRYTVPERVKIETKVVEVEKKVQDKQQDKQVETKIVTKKNTDGSIEETKIITENTKTDTKTDTDKNKSTDTTSETVRGSDKTTISVLAGYDIINNKTILGGMVYKPVLGPIGIGVFGFTNSTIGATVGLSF